jgi:hypothetical protein
MGVGWYEGAGVGEDGAEEGDVEGAEDGAALGSDEGAPEGAADGLDGAMVGADEGALEGANDGYVVGTSVSWQLLPRTQTVCWLIGQPDVSARAFVRECIVLFL